MDLTKFNPTDACQITRIEQSHADWHVMKDPRFRGLHLITYLDDASRCVTCARLFKEATSENAVMALRQAIKEFGTPATILSDNGSALSWNSRVRGHRHGERA